MAYIRSDLTQTASGDEPMWGNVGSELDRMFPSDVGFSDALSSIGFWGGGGALNQALKGRLEQETSRRKAKAATDVANIAANQAQNQAMMRLFEQVYGHLPLEYQRLAQQGDIANMKSQIDLWNHMNGNQIGIQKAQIGANATLGAAKIGAEGRKEAAAMRPPSVRSAPQMWLEQKANQIKSAFDKVPENVKAGRTMELTDAMLQAEREYEITRTGDKNEIRKNQAANLDKVSSLPESDFPVTTEQGTEGPVYMSVGGMSIPDVVGPSTKPSNPMARFTSKGQGLPTEMTRRMYAPPDELANPGNGGQVQWPTVRNERGEKVSAGGVQGSQVVNDPRVAAREQSLANLTEPLTNGPMPSPQSRFSKENPQAWEDLMTLQGYAPPEPSIRQTGGSEDVLRAPMVGENKHVRDIANLLMFGPTVGPVMAKIASGEYSANPRNVSQSPILDMLPYVAGGIGALATMPGAINTSIGQPSAYSRFFQQMKGYKNPNMGTPGPSMPEPLPPMSERVPQASPKYPTSPKPSPGGSYSNYWDQWTQRPTPGVGTIEGPMWGEASMNASFPTTPKMTQIGARGPMPKYPGQPSPYEEGIMNYVRSLKIPELSPEEQLRYYISTLGR